MVWTTLLRIDTVMKKVRCAIYTRKSSEEGLDQDFNSLDAQREACEAYVASQKHEGWVVLSDHYDDGGLSGGTLERPALQKLLQAVDDGLVDQIIVYKIDRLTRSLMDFSRLIERLDAAEASFVSVTQSFNTATSMGRLTLNVLLSFAQFEREVTAERIRDKIAASKKKGLWMGGPVPLGYRAEDRKLVINEEEASTVRQIFDLYIELETVRALKHRTDLLGLTSRRWTTKAGEERGGKSFTRGHLYRILTNPIYTGQVAHKGRAYDGQHQGIIERETWDAVQSNLKQDAVKPRASRDTEGENKGSNHSSPQSSRQVSPLSGKLYDETGDCLTPSHANRKGKRYRYYVSNRLIKRSGEAEAKHGGWRLPAKGLEDAVADVVVDWMKDELLVGKQLLPGDPAVESTKDLVDCLARLRDHLGKVRRPIELFAHLIDRVTISTDKIIIDLNQLRLIRTLGLAGPIASTDETESVSISSPFKHRKRGVESKLVLGLNSSTNIDPVLITNIARARHWLNDIKNGTALSTIASKEGRSIRIIQRHLELAFLSPKIIRQIVEGAQPPEFTSRQLLHTTIPACWNEQHTMLGIN